MSHFFRMARTGWTVLRKPPVVRTRPLHFQLEPAVGCNLKCQTCQVPAFAADRREFMPLDRFRTIFDKVRPIKIGLSGMGEPFLNPELLDIVRHARQGGASVLTTTNFTLVGKKIDQMVDSGLNLVKISLDAAKPETYHKIRGLDLFEAILGNIRELQRAKRERHSRTPFIRLQFVLQSDNIGEVEQMVSLAHDLGANAVYFQPLDTLYIPERKDELTRGIGMDVLRTRLEAAQARAAQAGVATNIGVLLPRLAGYYRKYQPGLPAEPPGRVCLLPWFSMYIGVNGDVRPCCAFSEPGVATLGNLARQSLEEVWNGEAAQSLRRLSLRRKLCYAACRNCTPNRLRDFVRLTAVLPGFFKGADADDGE